MHAYMCCACVAPVLLYRHGVNDEGMNARQPVRRRIKTKDKLLYSIIDLFRCDLSYEACFKI